MTTTTTNPAWPTTTGGSRLKAGYFFDPECGRTTNDRLEALSRAIELVTVHQIDDPKLDHENSQRADDLYIEARGNIRNLAEAVYLVEHLLDFIDSELADLLGLEDE